MRIIPPLKKMEELFSEKAFYKQALQMDSFPQKTEEHNRDITELSISAMKSQKKKKLQKLQSVANLKHFTNLTHFYTALLEIKGKSQAS